MEIGKAWLHRPTGSAGVMTIVSHFDGGPIVGGSERVLDAAVSDPADNEINWPGLTDHDVEVALAARGWRVVTRADAAQALTEAGYLLGDNRGPGHILHLDEADDSTWRDEFGRVCRAAFVAREG